MTEYYKQLEFVRHGAKSYRNRITGKDAYRM